MNELVLKMQSGSDIYETVTGLDPKTDLKYRFDQFKDITLHVSAMLRDDPYLQKVLTHSTDDVRDLIIDLTEDELLNKNAQWQDNYQLISVPNTFYFYINARDENDRRVILFSGIISYVKFNPMRFA